MSERAALPLRRARAYEVAGGKPCWESEDARFLIYRQGRALANGAWTDRTRRWRVISADLFASEQLKTHGVSGRSFSTRGELLARLQDMLELEAERAARPPA